MCLELLLVDIITQRVYKILNTGYTLFVLFQLILLSAVLSSFSFSANR